MLSFRPQDVLRFVVAVVVIVAVYDKYLKKKRMFIYFLPFCIP